MIYIVTLFPAVEKKCQTSNIKTCEEIKHAITRKFNVECSYIHKNVHSP